MSRRVGQDAPGRVSFGAYGFALRGLGRSPRGLLKVPQSWPELRVSRRTDPVADGAQMLSDDRARLVFEAGGVVDLQREPARAVFRTPRRLADEELLHPFLGGPAAVVARWLGRESFHAGAFVSGGAAWGLVGERESGKSSVLAQLALEGYEVLVDDVLVVDETIAFAGPRSIDLRGESAARLGAGEALGVVGARERWRLRLGPAPAELPLGGWVYLAWGDRTEARPLRGAQRLQELGRHRALRVPPARPELLLELAALPTWELRRPRSWASVGDAARCLLETVGA
jgi:hypothetical protein